MKLKLFVFGLFLSFGFSSLSLAADTPSALMRVAESADVYSYEVLLTPQYLIDPDGSYLSSELRYQLSEDWGAGVGFGSGQIGFNIGGHAVWYVTPDLKSQPAFSILGGFYFNRFADQSFLVMRVVPTISKTVGMSWGRVTPYAGLHFAPSFAFGDAKDVFSIRTTMGGQVDIHALGGLKMWGEFGLAIEESLHQIAFGLSFPFEGLEG